MAKTDQIRQEEMKRFLFNELSETERDLLEDRLFAEDDFVYELIDLENLLVDRYTSGQMSPDETTRFEFNLQNSPEGREKIANSIALQKYISGQKNGVSKFSLLAEIKTLFTFHNRMFQFASVGLLLLIIGGFFFLLIERNRSAQEITQVQIEQNRRENEFNQKEKDLQNQNRESQQREQNLNNQLEEKNKEAKNLNKQTQTENNENTKPELEPKNVKKEKDKTPTEKPHEINPQIPAIIISLLPFSTGKGAGDENTKTIKTRTDTKIIQFNLEIPTENKSEHYEAKLNNKIIASDKKPIQKTPEKRVLLIPLPTSKLIGGENTITLTGETEKLIYIFRLIKNQNN